MDRKPHYAIQEHQDALWLGTVEKTDKIVR